MTGADGAKRAPLGVISNVADQGVALPLELWASCPHEDFLMTGGDGAKRTLPCDSSKAAHSCWTILDWICGRSTAKRCAIALALLLCAGMSILKSGQVQPVMSLAVSSE